MKTLIDKRFDRSYPFDDTLLMAIDEVVYLSLRHEDFDTECEISVSLVDNNEIQLVNKKFRGIDAPTDVLSFPQLEFTVGEIPERNESGEIILGDIVISIERAEAQAKEYGHSLKRELAFLTAHSMLHLLGYDHMTPEDEEIMCRKQEEILKTAGIGR